VRRYEIENHNRREEDQEGQGIKYHDNTGGNQDSQNERDFFYSISLL
jgi:hypothetical protein